MAKKPRIGDGDVAITLDGKACKLRPSLGACQTIDRAYRGLGKAVALLQDCSFDTIVFVVAAGLGKDPEDVEDAVFATGALNLMNPCIEFVSIIGNGGRRIEPEDEGGEEAGDPPN